MKVIDFYINEGYIEMASIQIKPKEVKNIEKQLEAIVEELSTIAYGNYTKTTLFTESVGESADLIDDISNLFQRTATCMQYIVNDTILYLYTIIEGFTYVENHYSEVFQGPQIHNNE